MILFCLVLAAILLLYLPPGLQLPSSSSLKTLKFMFNKGESSKVRSLLNKFSYAKWILCEQFLHNFYKSSMPDNSIG